MHMFDFQGSNFFVALILSHLYRYAHHFHLKKMPTEVGELEARVPSMAYGFTAQRHRNGVLV